MNQHLFVYGTLMRSAADASLGKAERRRLDLQAEWLGEARIGGHLHDLGAYPILTAAETPRATVHGEVYRLRDPQSTFTWLDIYEGIPPGQTRGAEYARVVLPVRLASRETIDAWVYQSIGPVGAAPLLPGGRWRWRG